MAVLLGQTPHDFIVRQQLDYFDYICPLNCLESFPVLKTDSWKLKLRASSNKNCTANR